MPDGGQAGHDGHGRGGSSCNRWAAQAREDDDNDGVAWCGGVAHPAIASRPKRRRDALDATASVRLQPGQRRRCDVSNETVKELSQQV